MKLRHLSIGTLIALVLAGPLQGADTEIGEAWRDDLRFLESGLQVRHADLFRVLDEAEWRASIAGLSARLDSLSDAEIRVELGRLIASVGDAHTALFLDDQVGFERRYPLEFYPIAEGWLILAAAEEYASLLGGLVETFGGKTPQELVAALRPLVASDNDHGYIEELLDYILLPELLGVLGLVENAGAIEVLVRHPDGSQISRVVRAVDTEDRVVLRYLQPETELPLWLRRRDEPYWLQADSDAGEVYVQFNSADIGRGAEEAFKAFCERIVRDVASEDVGHLEIDLRWNDGGSYWRTRHLLGAVLRAAEHLPSHGLFVLIGPHTFSAVVMHALRLEEHTSATFVGQPTAGAPNHTGTMRRLRLPATEMVIAYSAIYKSPANDVDHRPFIAPDVWIELTPSDYRDGIDTVLEAVRRPTEKRGVGSALTEWIDSLGVEGTIERYHAIPASQRHRYRFGEREFDSIGHRLLSEGRVREAIAIFTLYSEEFPWSANAFDSLARPTRPPTRSIGRFATTSTRSLSTGATRDLATPRSSWSRNAGEFRRRAPTSRSKSRRHSFPPRPAPSGSS